MQKVAKKLIEKCGIPGRDLYELPTSAKRFPDGYHYRLAHAHKFESVQNTEGVFVR